MPACGLKFGTGRMSVYKQKSGYSGNRISLGPSKNSAHRIRRNPVRGLGWVQNEDRVPCFCFGPGSVRPSYKCITAKRRRVLFESEVICSFFITF